jgi:hypothetical protein
MSALPGRCCLAKERRPAPLFGLGMSPLTCARWGATHDLKSRERYLSSRGHLCERRCPRRFVQMGASIAATQAKSKSCKRDLRANFRRSLCRMRTSAVQARSRAPRHCQEVRQITHACHRPTHILRHSALLRDLSGVSTGTRQRSRLTLSRASFILPAISPD